MNENETNENSHRGLHGMQLSLCLERRLMSSNTLVSQVT